MKTLFAILFTIGTIFTSSENNQAKEKIKATFIGYADGIYNFTDENDYTIEFEHIQKPVLARYDLSTDEFKGKLFIITYETDLEEDEEGDEISTNIIIDLELIE